MMMMKFQYFGHPVHGEGTARAMMEGVTEGRRREDGEEDDCRGTGNHREQSGKEGVKLSRIAKDQVVGKGLCD